MPAAGRCHSFAVQEPAGKRRAVVDADVAHNWRSCYADWQTTSRLSPYLRRRLVLEEEVLGFARTVGTFERVEKFMQEVVWRTYWKGWLEARPGCRGDGWPVSPEPPR